MEFRRVLFRSEIRPALPLSTVGKVLYRVLREEVSGSGSEDA